MGRVLAAAAAVFFGIAPLSAAELESIMLLYQAQEPGIAPYASRILVTGRFIRMDDGIDDGDYLIFDRKKRLISSVTHDDRTVFEIPAREVTLESPIPLELRTESVAAGEAVPKVAGKVPQHRRLYVNGSLCYDVVALPGVLEEAVVAMREFRQVLAGEQARVLLRTPADMQEPCDLTLNTFHPEWQLQFGLPLQEWDGKGNRQVLMNFEGDFRVDEKLFELPEGYIHYDTSRL